MRIAGDAARGARRGRRFPMTIAIWSIFVAATLPYIASIRRSRATMLATSRRSRCARMAPTSTVSLVSVPRNATMSSLPPCPRASRTQGAIAFPRSIALDQCGRGKRRVNRLHRVRGMRREAASWGPPPFPLGSWAAALLMERRRKTAALPSEAVREAREESAAPERLGCSGSGGRQRPPVTSRMAPVT